MEDSGVRGCVGVGGARGTRVPTLTYVRKSVAANPEGAGPVIVHCRSVVRGRVV